MFAKPSSSGVVYYILRSVENPKIMRPSRIKTAHFHLVVTNSKLWFPKAFRPLAGRGRSPDSFGSFFRDINWMEHTRELTTVTGNRFRWMIALRIREAFVLGPRARATGARATRNTVSGPI
ncbi:hypothetical protein CCP2SC5_360008 [Azospirillaceae bacterium]